ncbi:hypothetical protein FOPE_10801 [Fonsecaea pedrosoi]|nr:hypothetical protein FOPE_10801 [Fonsecaea pedrosoi]
MISAKKPGGGLRSCVDYRALSAMTVKTRYRIPQMKDILSQLCKVKYCTKLDIIAAFNNLRIKEGDEWETAFTTKFDSFEYLMMPFGLCNAPSSFQGYIDDALQNFLDVFWTDYLDDILIYSQTLEEHIRYVKRVLAKLREKELGLYMDLTKSEFHVQEVQYLGLIVSTQGI